MADALLASNQTTIVTTDVSAFEDKNAPVAASTFEDASIPHSTVDVPVAESELEDVPESHTPVDNPLAVDAAINIAPAADISDETDTIVVAGPFIVTHDAPLPRLTRSKRGAQVITTAASASSLVPVNLFDAGGRKCTYVKICESSNVKILSNPRRNESAPNSYLRSYPRLQMTMRMVTMLQVTKNLECSRLLYLQRGQRLGVY